MNNPMTVFVHIPKTAGTTLNRMLEEQYGRDHIAYLHDDPSWSSQLLVQKCNHPHSTINAISGHFPFGIHHRLSRPCNYVTFVRDPVELYLSMYSYIRRNPIIPSHSIVKALSFHQFIECQALNHLTHNLQTKYLTGIPGTFIFEDGKRYFNWDPGDIKPNVKRAKENVKNHFTFVGITERFHSDVHVLANKLGWTQPVHVYHDNRSEHRQSRHELSQDTIQLIYSKNQLDVELYHFVHQLQQT